jgi:hypothetical protein
LTKIGVVINFAIKLNLSGPAIVCTEPASGLKRPPSASFQALLINEIGSPVLQPALSFCLGQDSKRSSIHQPVLAFLETIGGFHDSTTLPFPDDTSLTRKMTKSMTDIGS